MPETTQPTASPHAHGQTTAKQRAAQERHAARLREREQARRRTQIRRFALIGGGTLLGFLVLAVLVHAMTNGTTTRKSTTAANIPGVVTYANLARDHTTATVTYAQVPPVGGAHSPVWLNCGIYEQPVPNENAVHSLEHGAVWLTYQPTLTTDQVAQLRALVKGQSKIILSPYAGIPAPVVVSAWGVQLQVPTVNDSRLATFFQRYQNGAQAPEPNGECSGGIGAPLP